jgi:SAM-dependent methyltransferase
MSAYGIGIASRHAYVVRVNENHANLCPSPKWATYIREDVLPYVTNLAPLGDVMLELGPGPGAATEWLRAHVRQLVAVESDATAAQLLAERYADTNVDVVHGDAAQLEFASNTFDSVGSFTMLHHVATFAGQQSLLQEAHRVLKPGGYFLGSDSLSSNDLHHFHEGDDYLPVDPASFLVRLQSVGFAIITIAIDGSMKFVARKSKLSNHVPCQDSAKEI